MESMDYGMLYGQCWDCLMLSSQRETNKAFLTAFHSDYILPLKKGGREGVNTPFVPLGWLDEN